MGLAREMDLCNDFADEGLEFGRGLCDLEGFAEHGLGFVEELRIFREESDEGLVGFEFVAEFGAHLDAGVRGDGVAGFGAAGSEALDGPAYSFAVHRGEVTGGWGGERASGGGLVVGRGVFEDGDVAVLGGDNF